MTNEGRKLRVFMSRLWETMRRLEAASTGATTHAHVPRVEVLKLGSEKTVDPAVPRVRPRGAKVHASHLLDVNQPTKRPNFFPSRPG